MAVPPGGFVAPLLLSFGRAVISLRQLSDAKNSIDLLPFGGEGQVLVTYFLENLFPKLSLSLSLSSQSDQEQQKVPANSVTRQFSMSASWMVESYVRLAVHDTRNVFLRHHGFLSSTFNVQVWRTYREIETAID